MNVVKLLCLVALVATAAAAGSLSDSQLPGRDVGQIEAESLRGGGCVNAKDNECGTGERCSGTLQCVKVYKGDGTGDPDCTKCVGTTCVIFKTVGTCAI